MVPCRRYGVLPPNALSSSPISLPRGIGTWQNACSELSMNAGPKLLPVLV